MRGLPYLALFRTVPAELLPDSPRWHRASGDLELRHDTPFDLMVAAPFVLLLGTVVDFFARGEASVRGRPRMPRSRQTAAFL